MNFNPLRARSTLRRAFEKLEGRAMLAGDTLALAAEQDAGFCCVENVDNSNHYGRSPSPQDQSGSAVMARLDAAGAASGSIAPHMADAAIASLYR